MKSALLLDVVVAQCATVLKLLTSKDKTLLVRGDTLLVLNLGLDIVDGVRRLNFQCDGLSRQCLDENLHTTTETENQVKGAFLLDVVVAQCATVFQLLAGENETLLVRRNTLLVLNFGLDIVDGVRRLNFQCDGLSRQCLDENLHTTTKTEDKVKGRLLLDVVIRKGAAILKLLSGEDQALLVRRNTLLVLDLRLDIVDGVGRLYLESDGLAGESLDEDLHTTAKAEDEVESRLLLDVVVGESTSILELLTSENQTLLVRRNALLVLNLRLDVVDGVGGFDLKGDGLSGDCMNVSALVTT